MTPDCQSGDPGSNPGGRNQIYLKRILVTQPPGCKKPNGFFSKSRRPQEYHPEAISSLVTAGMQKGAAFFSKSRRPQYDRINASSCHETARCIVFIYLTSEGYSVI
jgi:hypothetical protein